MMDLPARGAGRKRHLSQQGLPGLRLDVNVFWRESLPEFWKSPRWLRPCWKTKRNENRLPGRQPDTWQLRGESRGGSRPPTPNHTVINAGEAAIPSSPVQPHRKALAMTRCRVRDGWRQRCHLIHQRKPVFTTPDHHVPAACHTDDIAQAYRGLLSRLQEEYIQTWVGLPPMEYNRRSWRPCANLTPLLPTSPLR